MVQRSVDVYDERRVATLSAEIAAAIDAASYGSGSSTKTGIVLWAADKLAAYVPVEISTEFLHAQMADLRG
ncbi:MAG: L-histidine N(alpha)-methyltransferase, partial [Rhizobiales bacterium]|nr:L-histidine N(alpha)-methyltransferase [Hyphomicrobiales bacterium]